MPTRTKAGALLFLFLTLNFAALRADEGMWLPFLLENLNQKEMKAMGCKLNADDIYSVNHTSLKDAVVQFGGGCTAEIISGKGLILTNHHCGFSQIQSHSSLEHDYLKNGFWAMKPEEELTCPGLTVTFLVRMEDVTEQALANVKAESSETERDSIIKKNINHILAGPNRVAGYDYVVMPFFNGNNYYLLVTQTFKDIRMVGAPPSSIGKFGSDADNWVWPRHTGDFSLFRIYANAKNEPAEYSKDNVPYTPKYFFPVSLKGEKPGDFTMVYGYPGRTNEYACSWAVDLIENISNPAKVEIRDVRLKIMDEDMRASEKVHIQYASKQSGVANQWKKWSGESFGLNHYHAVERKQAYEKEFQKRVEANPAKFGKYTTVLNDLHVLYDSLKPLQLDVDYYNEIAGGIEAVKSAAGFLYLEKLSKAEKPDTAAIHKAVAGLRKGMAGFFKDYNEPTDHRIAAELLRLYVQKRPADQVPPVLHEADRKYKGDMKAYTDRLYAGSMFVSKEKVDAFLKAYVPADVTKLESDSLFLLTKSMSTLFTGRLQPAYARITNKLNVLNRIYLKAQMEVMPEKRYYPDANLTLRLAYGKVKSYSPRDAVDYNWFTTIDGIMEKEDPAVDEFHVDPKLKELWKKKDYGQYADKDKNLHVAFIANNHTTGGNSGSPVLDASGYLIGTNFDRCWEGTMSDEAFDPDLCRNISVDIRYTLFVIDKFAGAGYLLGEMKLVR